MRCCRLLLLLGLMASSQALQVVISTEFSLEESFIICVNVNFHDYPLATSNAL